MERKQSLPARTTDGFTLLEAMVALAVLAVLTSMGIPAYQALIQRQRVDTTMHLLTSHLATARITAITHRIPTVVCPSDGQGGCLLGRDWTQGWLMFLDSDGNHRPDRQEDILRDERRTLDPSLRIVSSQGRQQLRYQPDGRSGGSNLTLRVCQANYQVGAVIINNVGRIRSARSKGTETCT